METRRRRTPLRILAPIALIAFAIALAMIVSSAGKSSGGGAGQSAKAAEKARDLGSKKRPARKRHRAGGALPQRIYIVKPGDTLGKIAQETGVPVQQLQNLNPGLDQFSLIAGQKIKLR